MRSSPNARSAGSDASADIASEAPSHRRISRRARCPAQLNAANPREVDRARWHGTH